jgi:hypothetical protein
MALAKDPEAVWIEKKNYIFPWEFAKPQLSLAWFEDTGAGNRWHALRMQQSNNRLIEGNADVWDQISKDVFQECHEN